MEEMYKWIIGALLALSGLVEISPIKINPWTAILRWFGKRLNGNVIDEVAILKEKVQQLSDRQEENEAKSARVRILRFGDELYQGKKHSKEHFDNILEDITTYNDYCRDHPDFKNERTKITEKQIVSTYQRCLTEHTFLQ
ncbi:MAG: hypothetical protein J6Q53_04500 [Oscillospiraceae bacterium]|nr:hypothetical protein [Oscillospiraceae bacterium]